MTRDNINLHQQQHQQHLLLKTLVLSVFNHFPPSNGRIYDYRSHVLKQLGIDSKLILELKTELQKEGKLSSSNRVKSAKELPDFEEVLYLLNSSELNLN